MMMRREQPRQQRESELMKFTIQCQRALIGNDIVVGIEADEEEEIAQVTTTLDKAEIGDDILVRTAVSSGG